ncbi:MAG: RNA polymerase sigma factor [Peptostreptococcaceae bacterium]|nr:RNA polymerase sigma factor [Peptostreptococcaceae bacterium]
MTEFEKIYRRYFRDVFLFLKSLSNDESIAEEMASETFFKAMQTIDSFRGDCDIRVWLCQIAKNTYYSYLKKQKRLVQLDELKEVATDDIGIEERISNSGEAMQIHQILHEMQEPYKEVFMLRVFGELSFKEIANIFKKTENWACVTYHRAKNKIREKMEVCDE